LALLAARRYDNTKRQEKTYSLLGSGTVDFNTSLTEKSCLMSASIFWALEKNGTLVYWYLLDAFPNL